MPLENSLSEVSRQRIAYLEALAMQIEEQLEKKNGRSVKIKEYDDRAHKMVSKEYTEAHARRKIEDMEREIQKLRGVPWYERNNRGILAVLAAAVRTVKHAAEFLNPATWMGLKIGMEDARRDMEREQEAKDREVVARMAGTAEKDRERQEQAFGQQEQEKFYTQEQDVPARESLQDILADAMQGPASDPESDLESRAQKSVEKAYSFATAGNGFESHLQSYMNALARQGKVLERQDAIVDMIAKDPNQIVGIPKEDLDQELLTDILRADAIAILENPEIAGPRDKSDRLAEDCITMIAKAPSIYPMMKEAIKDTGLLDDRKLTLSNGQRRSIFNSKKILYNSTANIQKKNPEFVNHLPQAQVTEEMAKALYNAAKNKEQIFFAIPRTENGDLLFALLNNMRPEAERGLPPVSKNSSVQMALYETITAMQRSGLTREAAVRAAIERYPAARDQLFAKDRAIIELAREEKTAGQQQQEQAPAVPENELEMPVEEPVGQEEEVYGPNPQEELEADAEVDEEAKIHDMAFALMDMAEGKLDYSADILQGISSADIVDAVSHYTTDTTVKFQVYDLLESHGEQETAGLLREKLQGEMEQVAARIFADPQAIIQARDTLMKDRSGENPAGMYEQDLIRKILAMQPDLSSRQKLVEGLIEPLKHRDDTYISMVLTDKGLADMIPFQFLRDDGFAENVANELYAAGKLDEFMDVPAVTSAQRLLSDKVANSPGVNRVPVMVYAQNKRTNNVIDEFVRLCSMPEIRDTLLQKDTPMLLAEMVKIGNMEFDEAYKALEEEPCEMPANYRGILAAHSIMGAAIYGVNPVDINILTKDEVKIEVDVLNQYINDEENLKDAYEIRIWLKGHHDQFGIIADKLEYSDNEDYQQDQDYDEQYYAEYRDYETR